MNSKLEESYQKKKNSKLEEYMETRGESNPVPLACEACALPYELRTPDEIWSEKHYTFTKPTKSDDSHIKINE